jgi:hypothetical protein
VAYDAAGRGYLANLVETRRLLEGVPEGHVARVRGLAAEDRPELGQLLPFLHDLHERFIHKHSNSDSFPKKKKKKS